MKVNIELSEDDVKAMIAESIARERGVTGDVEVNLVYRQARGDQPREIVAKVEYEKERDA